MKNRKGSRGSSITDKPSSGRGKGPLFIRLHQSGNSVGIYFPVPFRLALGVKAGDTLRAAIDESGKRLVLTPAE